MDSAWLLPILFATGFSAGFVDSIAGGGGLLTIPVLLSLGIPTTLTLGTNKLQASFGSGSATWHYARAGLLRSQPSRPGVAFTAIGSAAGAILALALDPGLLRLVIPWLLLGVAIYSLLQPQLGSIDHPAKLHPLLFHAGFGLLLGFYDGFFGPGTGTFWAIAFVLGAGFNLTRATAHTKLMNFTSNIVSLLFFCALGQVLYLPGLVMGIGQVLGARLGSRLVIRKGARLIRPLFISVALALTIKLLIDNFFPGRR